MYLVFFQLFAAAYVSENLVTRVSFFFFLSNAIISYIIFSQRLERGQTIPDKRGDLCK